MTRSRRVLPGFGLTLGFTLAYLSLIVLLPLSTIFAKSVGLGWEHVWWPLGAATSTEYTVGAQ